MSFLSFPQTTPFDTVTGDLLPNYRDAYLHGQLAPTVALKVELYLKKSPVQTSVVLGRYHELAAAAQRRGRTVMPPLWVQEQLLLQATAAPAGPLRRPVMRLAVGLFAALSVASVLQWMRNAPLVPVRVVAVVSRVASSASAAPTRREQQFSPPPATRLPTRKSVPRHRPMAGRHFPKPAAAPLVVAASAARALRAQATADSLAIPVAPTAAATAVPARGGTVRGRVSDANDQP